ncbi:hypothetical protein PHLCEN_2v11589 [Hermanssonia centrifuga]|uniref:DUF6532 domain-containing protein n=1 Tax=Hermanssonia centrifuga TaxID=98765 RepID=A0A2R6NJQ2_9APHY|nr:hypothetical protein PHLCEN_2v11589 [Hermanssonia centrifuga]
MNKAYTLFNLFLSFILAKNPHGYPVKANLKASQRITAEINDGDDDPESGSANESKLSGEESSSYAPSEDDDDLRVTAERGNYAIKEKLQREKPQWVRPLVIANNNEGAADVDDNTLMDINQLPMHGSRSRRSSTSSGGAPLSTSPGVSDEDDDKVIEPEHGPRITSAKSHREKAVEAERPCFKDSETQKGLTPTPNNTGNRSGEPSQAAYVHGRKLQHKRRETIHDAVEGELKWPAQTRLAYVSVNKINKKDQSATIQCILTREIIDFTVDFSFAQAIYRADDRIFYQQKLAIDAARQLGYEEAALRLQEDLHYAKVMIDVGETRLGIIRGRMKKTAAGLTPVVFHLEEGACERRVARLLLDCQFVYPGDVEKSLDFKNPFDITIITAVLAAHFFNGPNSIASQHRQHLKSSIPEKPHEKEIPEAMLAMACAAIALALLDWDSGRYMPARDFNIAYAKRVYGLAIGIMHYIKEKSVNMYHRVMHKVYGNVW